MTGVLVFSFELFFVFLMNMRKNERQLLAVTKAAVAAKEQAEDNELNQEIAVELLGNATGAAVETALDGQEAVEMFQASAPGYYDMILMDIQMPNLDGYAATRAIRAMDRPDAASIPIFAMTANAFSEDAKKCLEAGMNAHLAKPLDLKKVYETLNEFFCEP